MKSFSRNFPFLFFLAKTHFLGQCSQPILIQPKSGRQIHKIPDEIQPASIPLRQFIIIDRCPACQVNYNNNNYLVIFVKFKKINFQIGILENVYSCIGMSWAIFLFPIGILCCLASRVKKCSHCLAKYPYL